MGKLMRSVCFLLVKDRLLMLKMAIFVTEKIRYTHRSTYTPFRSANLLSGFRFHPIRMSGCGILMSMPDEYVSAQPVVE
jgi:hypothetical protein